MAVEAGRLGGAELVVVEIGIVDHRGDLVERRIGQLVAGQDGLERASALVVAEFDTAHVERRAAEAAAASASAAKANSAPGSTKRRRSQAHAVRSMCGCGRVIQSMLVSWGPSPRKWRLDPRDGGCDRDLGVYPAGCAEVVTPALEPERAIESLELAERRSGINPCAAAPAGTDCLPDPLSRLRHCRIAGVSLGPEPADQLPILRLIQAQRLPDERGPPLLTDFIREPLEGLPGLRVRRQDPDRIVEQQGAQPAQPAPDAKTKATRRARQPRGEEHPPDRGHGRNSNHGYIDRNPGERRQWLPACCPLPFRPPVRLTGRG